MSLAYIFFILPLSFGSTAWNPDMIPFCTVLSLYCYLSYIETKRGWYLVPGILGLTVAFQLHYQAVLLFPFTFLVISYALWTDKKVWKFLLLAVSISLVTFSGYFLAELKNNFSNSIKIFNYFFYQNSNYFDRVSKPAFIYSYVPDFIDRVLIGTNKYYSLFSIGRILFLIGFPVMAVSAFKNSRQNRNYLFVFIYFLSILIMMRVYKGDKLDYYLSPLFVFPAFLFAYLIKIHKIFTLLFIISSIFIFQYIYTIPYSNQYNDIESVSLFLQSQIPDKSARFYFYNDDDLNTFAFGIKKFTELSINQNDTDIIEICRISDICAYDTVLVCKYSKRYTQLAALKADSGYVENKHVILGKFQIVIGKLHISTPLKQKFYTEGEAGSDKLLRELYE